MKVNVFLLLVSFSVPCISQYHNRRSYSYYNGFHNENNRQGYSRRRTLVCEPRKELRGGATFYSRKDWMYATGLEYDPSTYCLWILMGSYGEKVEMWFENFYRHSDCQRNYVKVYNGPDTDSPLIGTYCGDSYPGTLKSSGSALTVALSTSYNYYMGPSYPKLVFRASYRAVRPSRISPPITTTGENCGSPTPQHKKVKLGIFYTDKLYNLWYSKTRTADPLPALQKLVQELNVWYTPEKLGYGSKVEFILSQKNVQRIADYITRYRVFVSRKLTMKIARYFCRIAHNRRRSYSQDWDIAFLLTTESYDRVGRGVGVTGGLRKMCSKTRNCGIVLKSYYKNSSTFFIYPKLLVHEIGHLFGLIEERSCIQQGFQGCTNPYGSSIMGSPGTRGSIWSHYSKKRIHDQFKDEREYPCLKWQCGQYRPNDMFSNPADKAILHKMCSSKREGYEVYENRWTEGEIRRLQPTDSYSIMLINNPQFYKVENVCKGVPCLAKQRCTGCYFDVFARNQEDLSNKKVKCGENKVCNKGNCVRRY